MALEYHLSRKEIIKDTEDYGEMFLGSILNMRGETMNYNVTTV